MLSKRALHIIIGIVTIMILAVVAVLLLLPQQGDDDITNAKLVMNPERKEQIYG
ncbi:MAG: hypothetical protein AAGU74_00110 [Bacillota bacterium]